MQRSVFIFMGPPGAGKGTLSARCVEELGWKQLSTGALCREHIARKTEIGKQIDFIIKSGKLISDSLIIALVEQWLLEQNDQRNCLILDGFPRTLHQANSLHELLQKEIFAALKLHVIRINIEDSLVVKRLTTRFTCSNASCQAIYNGTKELIGSRCSKCSSVLMQRPDDQEHTIRERLAVYYEHAQALAAFYKDRGYGVLEVSGEYPMDEVFASFKRLLGDTDIGRSLA